MLWMDRASGSARDWDWDWDVDDTSRRGPGMTCKEAVLPGEVDVIVVVVVVIGAAEIVVRDGMPGRATPSFNVDLEDA